MPYPAMPRGQPFGGLDAVTVAEEQAGGGAVEVVEGDVSVCMCAKGVVTTATEKNQIHDLVIIKPKANHVQFGAKKAVASWGGR